MRPTRDNHKDQVRNDAGLFTAKEEEAEESTQIPFHPRFEDEVASGMKRFTIRWNYQRDIQPGDTLVLVDGDRERLKVANCSLMATVPAGFLPSWQFDGHRDYTTFAELQEELEEFYPDAVIDPNTPLTVIGW